VANTAAAQASIGNGQTMNADAARYWVALVAAVAAFCGVSPVATEGTRTYARQMFLWVNRNKPGFNPAWHPDSPYAYHLSGRAVDVGSGVGFLATVVSVAFYKLAGLYGFRPTVKGEPWHFEWRREWVGISLETADVTKVIISNTPDPSEEDDMAQHQLIKTPINGKDATGGIYRWLVNPNDFTMINVNTTQWDFWKSRSGVQTIDPLQNPEVIASFRQIK
jgi:hypothetical protein